MLKIIREGIHSVSCALLLNSFIFREHSCMVFKLIGPQLSTFSLKKYQILKYSLDIITSLCYLHQNNIIHCDIKPSNILINSEDAANLIDFGTSCFKGSAVYSYIQSRSYRSPEVIFRLNYTEKIDI